MFEDFLRKAHLFFNTFISYTFSQKIQTIKSLSKTVLVSYYHGEHKYLCLLKNVPFEDNDSEIISLVNESVNRMFCCCEHTPMPNRALYSDQMNVDKFNMFLGPFGDFHAFFEDDMHFPYETLPVNWNLVLKKDNANVDDDTVFVVDSLMNEITTSSMTCDMFSNWKKDVIFSDTKSEQDDERDLGP